MDAAQLARELTTQFETVGIGHEISLAPGGAGVVVLSRYADPMAIVESGGRFQMVAQTAPGDATTIETDLAADSPSAMVTLYLTFHSLWSIHRLVGRLGALAAVRQHPSLPAHKSLLVAHIGVSTSDPDPLVADYARALMENARTMLRAH